VVFTLASLIGGLATTGAVLVAARVGQGVGRSECGAKSGHRLTKLRRQLGHRPGEG